MPLVSHGSLAETSTGARGIGQIEYVFCELPKLRGRLPTTDVERWVTLFVHAHELKPSDVAGVLLTAVQREALELANEATFTEAELEAYRKARDEVQQRIQYGRDQKVLRSRAITLDDARRARVEACQDDATLDAWLDRALDAADLDAVFAETG